MADGFVLIGVGSNKQLVRWTAECAWRGVGQQRASTRHPRGCKAVRFLLSVVLMSAALLALGAWRGINLPTALLIAAFCGAAGHALARPFEDKLGVCFSGPVRHNPEAGGVRVEVEPVEFPEWLWWKGSEGFIVRRIPEGGPHRD